MSHHVYTTTTGQAVHKSMTERAEDFRALETLPGVPDESYAVGRCSAASCGSWLYAWPRGLASLDDRAALRCVRCAALLRRTSRAASGTWRVLPLRYLEATYALAVQRADEDEAKDAEYLAGLAASGTSADGLAYARSLRLENRAAVRKPLEAKLRKLRKLVAAEDAAAAKLVDAERSAEDALQAAHEAARAAVEAADAAWLDGTYVDADTEAARRAAVDSALDARRETRSALEAAGLVPVPHVHHYASTSAAYDASQTDERVEAGDVLVCASEGAAAVLVSAWPTAATEATAGESFHVLADGSDWSALESLAAIGGRTDYSASAAVLASELAKLAEAAKPLPDALRAAMLAAWCGQCYREATDMPDDPTAVLAALDARTLQTGGHGRRARQAAARATLVAAMDEAAKPEPEASTEPDTAARSTLAVSPAAEDMDAERCRSCGCRSDWHDAMDMACPEDTDEPHPYSMAADALPDEDEDAEAAKRYALAADGLAAWHADTEAADEAAKLLAWLPLPGHVLAAVHELADVLANPSGYADSDADSDARAERRDTLALELADYARGAMTDEPAKPLAYRVERQCSGTEDGWLHYVLDADGARATGSGYLDADGAEHEAADLARLAALAASERAAVETLRSAMQGSPEDTYGLACLVPDTSGTLVAMEYREATASGGWTPERMRADALVDYGSTAVLVDADGCRWTAKSMDVAAVLADALEDAEATSQRLRETLAHEHARTLPDMSTSDGSALVVNPGAVLPDGSVVVAGSASEAHVWHVLSMRPGWHAADTYRVATYARPGRCEDAAKLAHYDGLADALADYASRCELGTTEAR